MENLNFWLCAIGAFKIVLIHKIVKNFRKFPIFSPLSKFKEISMESAVLFCYTYKKISFMRYDKISAFKCYQIIEFDWKWWVSKIDLVTLETKLDTDATRRVEESPINPFGYCKSVLSLKKWFLSIRMYSLPILDWFCTKTVKIFAVEIKHDWLKG